MEINEQVLPCIELILTNDHKKLINEIYDRKDLIIKTKNNQLNLQIVPEHARGAFSYLHKLADEKSDVLSIEQICHTHRLLGFNGKLRDPASSWFDVNNIGINGYLPPPGESVEPLLNEYVKQYTSVEKSDNPLEKICRAYFLFEQIHPFSDGNGRTGRAICAWLMFKYGYGLLAPYIEKQWGKESRQHAEAFKSEIRHYIAWLSHPDYLNRFYSKFYFYFLKEVINILNQLDANKLYDPLLPILKDGRDQSDSRLLFRE